MFSVVIPVYNEEARLRQSLEEVDAYLRTTLDMPFEIICADDGSTDRSVAIAQEAARVLPVKVLTAPENQGKGAAVRRGVLAIEGHTVVFFDADLSTPLAEIPLFLRAMEEQNADLVIGTRKHPEAQIERYQPGYRVKLGLAYTRLVHVLTGTHFSDYTCGFKMLKADAARAIFSRSRITRWSFDAEILFLATRLGLQTVEVPVRWADDPDSRVRLFQDILGSFRDLLKIRMHQALGRYDLP